MENRDSAKHEPRNNLNTICKTNVKKRPRNAAPEPRALQYQGEDISWKHRTKLDGRISHG